MNTLSNYFKWQLLLALLLLNVIQSRSQGINDSGFTLHQMLDSIIIRPGIEDDTDEGGALTNYKAAASFWSARVSSNISDTANMFKQYYRTLNNAVAARMAGGCSGGGQFQGAWQCIGPDKLDKQGMGYVECIWVSPSHENIILAGTYGGLFKTVDGGAHWKCITDNAPIANGMFIITSIAVEPGNEDVIYLGTGSSFWEDYRIQGNKGIWGASIIKTTDGGQTWQQEIVGTTANPGDVFDRVQKIYFTPSGDHIIVFKTDKIFIRPTSGGSWVEVTGTTNPLSSFGYQAAQWRDLEFVPGDINADNHFFIASANCLGAAAAGISEVVNSGGTWSVNPIIDMGIGHNSIGVDSSLRAEISIPNNNDLFALFLNDATRLIARYDLTTQQWYLIKKDPDAYFDIPHTASGSDANNFDPNYLKGEFVVSPYKVSATPGGTLHYNMYVGGLDIWQSYDGGQTFICLGNYWGPNTHGDVRHLILYTPTASDRGVDDVFYIATDGGVAKKSAGTDPLVNLNYTCEDISGTGLTCTNFWGVATSESGGMLTAGAQHDGLFAYEPDKTPHWFLQSYGDAASTTFDEADKKKSWGTGWANERYYYTSSANGRDMGTWNDITAHYPHPPAFPKDDTVANFAVPLWSDRNNDQYTGQQSLWVKPSGDTLWYSLSDPVLYFSRYLNLPRFSDNYIRAMAFNPYETTPVGYVIYNKGNNLNSLKMWRRIPGTSYPNFGSVALPTSQQITDVTLDPKDPNRVWISVGEIVGPSGGITKNRLFYSANAGTTWHDVSKGLPERMPVTGVVFQEGTNNVYCVTDVGFFKCDFANFDPNATLQNSVNPSVEWICFDKPKINTDPEFPNVFVTKLAINYCQGKLYAATYGRGIWSTDMYDFDDFPVTQPDVISSSITWNSDHYPVGDVKVTAGTLTISNTTVHMPRNGHIIVEPGAKLVIDHSTITNDCSGCMWYGIEAAGDRTLPQTAANQAWVVIDNSTIEHARSAVMNWDKDPRVTHTGGVIRATNSYFINNRRSVELESYHNKTPGGLLTRNLSYFINCTFKIDDNYRGGANNYPFYSMVSMWDVEGIQFIGCQFLNLNTGIANKGKAMGIISAGSGFSVLPYCSFPSLSTCYSPVRSTFKGFSDGILIIGNMSIIQTIDIDQADFDEVAIGVHNNAMNNVSVTRCNFNVGNGSYVQNTLDIFNQVECHDNIGIYNKNTEQFRIEENTFNGIIGNGRHTYGTIIENSQENNNIIYRNTFNLLDYGAFTLGYNGFNFCTTNGYGDLVSDPGLDFQCNTFYGNTVDIYVDGDASYMKGIKKVMGSADKEAGNTFNSSSLNFVNNGYSLFYYGLTSMPTSVSGPVNLFTANNTNNCYSSFGFEGWSTVAPNNTELDYIKNDWYAKNSDYQDASNSYNSLIDGGNTVELVDEIANLPDFLMVNVADSYSPFLSKEAMQYAFFFMSDPYRYQLLYDNPDLINDDDILDQASYYFSEEDIDAIKDLASYGTERGSMEATIRRDATVMANDANLVLMALKTPRGSGYYTLDTNNIYYGVDSTATFASGDSINTWLQNTGKLWAQYELLGHFNYPDIFPSFWGNDIQLMDSMSNAFSIAYDPTKLADYVGYTSLYTFLSYLRSDGRSLYQMYDYEQVNPAVGPMTPLFDPPPYWFTSTLKSPVLGQTIMDVNRPYPSEPPIILYPWIPCMESTQGFSTARKAGPQQTVHHKLIKEQTDSASIMTNTSIAHNSFSAYPNPARGNVVFSYSVYSLAPNAVLIITNTVGVIIQQYDIKDQSGVIHWDTHQLSPGMYTYRFSNGEHNDIGKIVVVQ